MDPCDLLSNPLGEGSGDDTPTNSPRRSLSPTPEPAPPENAPVPQRPNLKAGGVNSTDKPKTSAKDGTTNAKNQPTSKSGAGMTRQMKVTSSPMSLPKPKSETSKIAPLAKELDKNVDKYNNANSARSKDAEDLRPRGFVRGQTMGSISPQINLTPSNLSVAGHSSAQRSARDLVRDNNRIKVFEAHLVKLEATQTAFLRKLEAMKASLPEKFTRQFKLIGMVQREDCKLVVHRDFLKKLPNKLPAHTVADFKQQIQDIFEGCLKAILDQVKNRGGPEIIQIEDIVEQEQAHYLSLLFEKINSHCSSNDILEQMVAKCKQESLEDKRFAAEQKRQMAGLKKAHASQLIAQEKALKAEFDLEISKKGVIIADLNREKEVLQTGQAMLEQTIASKTNDLRVQQEEQARLTAKIDLLKDTQAVLTKKLEHIELARKSNLREVEDKMDEIAKDYAQLEEFLKLIKKELQETKDSAVEVAKYREENKKLNQRLLEKDKEFKEHYPAEMKRLMLVNAYLNRQTEKLKAELIRSHRSGTQILKELQCDSEMECVFRAKDKKPEQNEAECGGDKQKSEINEQLKWDEVKVPASKLRSNKRMLSRQEDLMKFMEEHVDRTDMVLVKQKERNVSLEKEVKAMKQIITKHNISLENSGDPAPR